ncbi:uncharacterized protein LOC100162464 [Acyrthosiphon pisum]|uniref:Uncharacterized protein n=1 Tax=Acyrthosiphon pisum TaxID=7029 RepID=A0A8R2NJL7_ACYPI|nr:uncharacterized protein LOC100162464 [Acyrthosiphon pisum]
MMTSSQNRRPPNQMSSTMSQGSGLGNFEQPPFLFRASSATPVIGNTVSYPNVVTISQRISTMYNPTTNGNVMSHLSQMRQFYNQHSNNNQAQHRQLQLQQIRQQQQIITTPHTQQAYSGQSVDGRLAFIQQRNALRNARSVTVAPSIETIDLLSPPSSPVPPTVQENPLRPNIAWGLTRIPERMRARDTSNNDAYESQMATLRREIQHQSAGGHFGATSTSIHTAIGGWYSTAAVRNIGPVQTLYSHHSPYPILLQNTYQSQRNWPPPPPYM